MIFLAMGIGIVIGLFWFPIKAQKINGRLLTGFTLALIFSMGVSLGSRDGFVEELASLGFESLIYAILAVVFSILGVYLLKKLFVKGDRHGNSSGS